MSARYSHLSPEVTASASEQIGKSRIGYQVYVLDSTADRNFGEGQATRRSACRPAIATFPQRLQHPRQSRSERAELDTSFMYLIRQPIVILARDRPQDDQHVGPL